jgi:AcrR family transcriptional regulator
MSEPADRPARARPERLRKGRTLAQRRHERREALLTAALDVFGTKGYAASSVDEICRLAYVSSRNFYEEFANREALLDALGERLVMTIFQALTDVDVEPGPDLARRRTRERVSRMVHALVDDPRVARIAVIETVGVSPELERRRRQAHHLYAGWLRDFVHVELDAKGVDGPHQQAFTLALVGAANELICDWVLQPDDGRSAVEELIDCIADLAMVLLLRQPAGGGGRDPGQPTARP